MPVPGYGRLPSDILVCGEAPGKTEYEQNRPFVGQSGKEQLWNFAEVGIRADACYFTNVSKTYNPGNPDPTEEEIAIWEPTLINEVSQCQPKIVLAIGKVAATYFLGPTTMAQCHGRPCYVGEFDKSRKHTAPSDTIIVPITHPAFGLRAKDKKTKLRAIGTIWWDYLQAANIIKNDFKADIPFDKYAGNEVYLDVSGDMLAALLNNDSPKKIAIDTEWDDETELSLQVSWQGGVGFVLWRTAPNFHLAIQALQNLADSGTKFITHCANTPEGTMADLAKCKNMGLDLYQADIIDIMYRLYLLRMEPMGLKDASWRFCGAQSEDFRSVIKGAATQRQLDYLRQASKIDPKVKRSTDRTIKEVLEGKVYDYGPVDPYKRWYNSTADRTLVEAKLGRMRSASLLDVDPARATWYAGRDPDLTFRLDEATEAALARLDLLQTDLEGREVLPIFATMQEEGMPASEERLSALMHRMRTEADTRSTIAASMAGMETINVNSNDQIIEVLERLKLTHLIAEKTPKGKPSVGKDSIEHLRGKHKAIDLILGAKEHLHIANSFCRPYIKSIQYNGRPVVTTILKPATVDTRRLASEEPNLLNVSRRGWVGSILLNCFIANEGEVFLSLDYSQIELRVLASRARSPILIKSFNDPNADAHKEIGSILFGKSAKDITYDERDITKTAVYGTCYLMGAHGLQVQMRAKSKEYSLEDCAKLNGEIKKILGIDSYIKALLQQARKDRYVRDSGGMYSYLPALNKGYGALRNECERKAVAAVISGTAQTIIQRAMIRLKPFIYRHRQIITWRLQYHDELIFTVKKGFEDWLGEVIAKEMVNDTSLGPVPLAVSVQWADAWGDL
jgi:uracil-DNA glycosylase family 4